jgi:hypothetical protein
MTCMTTTYRGWQAASRAIGLPIRSLRRLHADGILAGTKADDGVWEFTREALDTAAAVARNANVLPPLAPAVAAATAYPDVPELGEPDPRLSAPVPAWLLAAAAEADDRAPEVARSQGTPAPLGAGGERPFWEAQAIAGPLITQAEAEALQAEAQLLRAQLAQRDQQIASLQHQFVQERRSHQEQIGNATSAFVRGQATAIAGTIAIESLDGAVAAGVIPEVVVATAHTIRDAVYRAVVQLQPGHLRQEPYALAIARQAAHVASLQITAQIEAERAEREMPRRRGRPRGFDRGGN